LKYFRKSSDNVRGNLGTVGFGQLYVRGGLGSVELGCSDSSKEKNNPQLRTCLEAFMSPTGRQKKIAWAFWGQRRLKSTSPASSSVQVFMLWYYRRLLFIIFFNTRYSAILPCFV